MKLLLVDVGHTYIKTCFYDKKCEKIFRFKTNQISSFNKIINLSKKADLVLIAAVHQLGLKLNKSIKHSKLVRTKDVKLSIRYNLNQLGVDRAVSAYAAVDLINPPFLIVSAGSAVTVDIVDSKKTFYGGAISLGIHAILEELKHVDKKLISNDKITSKNISKSTSESIKNGVILSHVGLIKEIISRNKRILKTAKIIFTGGDGKLLKDCFKGSNNRYFDNLVLKGLLKYHKNKTD
jgi:pantothenate kinase type III